MDSHIELKPPLTKENVYKILVPCWNSEAVSLINNEVYKSLKVFDGILTNTL